MPRPTVDRSNGSTSVHSPSSEPSDLPVLLPDQGSAAAVSSVERAASEAPDVSKLLVLDLNEAPGDAVPTGDLPPADAAELSPRPGRSIDVQTPDQHRMAALLRLAKRGDGEAFGRIYDRYVNQVYRYLYYRVGSHAVAEDLTSETFLRALRRIDSFSWQGHDIGAWFMTIARNLVNDHVKSKRFRLEVSSGDMLDADGADDGIEQAVVDRLHGIAVLEAVRELKAEQQECVVLRFLQGLSVAETAKVMNRSDGAIKQLQLRAIRSLARALSRREADGRRRNQELAPSLSKDGGVAAGQAASPDGHRGMADVASG